MSPDFDLNGSNKKISKPPHHTHSLKHWSSPQGGGEVLLKSIGGSGRQVFPNPDLISDQKMSFFHTRFQIWLLRDYVIIT